MEQNNEPTAPEGTSPMDASTAATEPTNNQALAPVTPVVPVAPAPSNEAVLVTAAAPAAGAVLVAAAAPSAEAPTAPAAAAPDAEHLAGHEHTAKRQPSRPIRLRTALFMSGAVAAIVLAAGGGGVALGASLASASAANSAAITASGEGATQPGVYTSPFGGSGTGSSDSGTSGGTGTTDGSGSADTSSTATAATDAQKVGVVTIVSNLYYSGNSSAAGTGVILTSSGEILTNNHVIDGATSIEVTVESTGATYTANVVGSDSTDDIAVLQLVGASGLATATTDATSAVAAGDTATSIGNAEGTGDLVAAAGTVTATDQSITVGNESTGGSESLSGLIEIDADVVSGDSGGPLVDADGDVIGIVTAASSGSTNVTGYAIPISTALTIADQILAGDESGNVTIGLPAFLGVELATDQGTTGVTVGGVIADTPAASAGLAEGDIITKVDGTSVTTSTKLSSIISAHDVGDKVTITYTTADGDSKKVSVTLTAGPAS